MKKLLFAFLLLSYSSFAQVSQLNIPNTGRSTVGFTQGMVRIDSVFANSILDTTKAKEAFPTMRMKGRMAAEGTQYYIHNGVGFVPITGFVRYADTLNRTITTKKYVDSLHAAGGVIDTSVIATQSWVNNLQYQYTPYSNETVQIFSDDFSRVSIGSNYATNFPDATVTIDADGLHFSGSAPNYNNYILRKDTTCANHFLDTLKYVINDVSGTAFGMNFGVRSVNAYGYTHNVIAGMALAAGSGNTGKSYITANAAFGYTSYGTDAIASLNVGDTIMTILERDGWTYTITSINLANGQTSTHSVSTTSGGSPFAANNTSVMSVNFFGGDIDVVYWSYTITDAKNADYMFIGNSITFGQAATSEANTYPNQFAALTPGAVVISNAGGADYTASLKDRLPEIIALHPSTVFIMLGGNDILFGVPLVDIEDNLIYSDSVIRANNINVIHLAPTPRNSTNVEPLRDFLATQFPTRVILGTYDDMVDGSGDLISSYDAGDGVHLNDAGMLEAATIIHNALSSTPSAFIQLPVIPTTSIRANGIDLPTPVLTPSGWKEQSIGLLDAKTKSSRGMSIEEYKLYMQSADATYPGLVNVTTQSFKGVKNFVDGLLIGKGGVSGIDAKITNLSTTANYSIPTLYPNSGTDVNSTLIISPRGAGLANNQSGFLIGMTDYVADQTNYSLFGFTAVDSIYKGRSTAGGTGTAWPISLSVQGPITHSIYIAKNGYVGMNKNNPHYVLDVAGDANFDDNVTAPQVRTGTTVSSAGTLTLSTATNYIFSGTTTTWTLPGVGISGRTYYIKNRGSGDITLNALGFSTTIYSTSAVATITIAAGASVILIDDGTFWNVL